ncbi:MAG: hypothetical protein H8E71_06290 [Candidatus Marinimicrobia bacterium]|nr:hypothetical protein [Candidatus Neomarinimicrobiota bacterium]MBL7109963.1 hypothetical protein [Candidatus Neomarinimicrobiota bacterium]
MKYLSNIQFFAILVFFSVFVLSPQLSIAQDDSETEDIFDDFDGIDEDLDLEDFEFDDIEDLDLENTEEDNDLLDDLDIEDELLEELEESEDDLEFEDTEFDELLEEFEYDDVFDDGVLFEDNEENFRGYTLSANLGTTSPFGANLKDRFSSGINFGLTVDTPYNVYLGPMNISFGGELGYSTFKGFESAYHNEDGSAKIYDDYNLINILGLLSTELMFFGIDLGFGISLSSYSGMYITSSFGVDYTLPINTGPVDIAINFYAQESSGAPEYQEDEVESGTSDIIGFGLIIKYPFNL